MSLIFHDALALVKGTLQHGIMGWWGVISPLDTYDDRPDRST
ncbi:hypothetical protein [Chamaesiphon sp.]